MSMGRRGFSHWRDRQREILRRLAAAEIDSLL